MPSLEEWERALATPRRVRADSSQSLIDQVQRLHNAEDAKRQQQGKQIPPRKQNLTELAAFSPPRDIEVIPAYLLLRLGVVTTPPVENLADICSTWAHIRYLWAFQIPMPNGSRSLRLSDEARKIDFHQKGLLSDEIGVGMSAVLLGDYFNAPLALDVSIALRDPNWRIRQRGDSSPDYLFFNSTQTALYVVECKGTQSSRSNSLKQLRRGTEQVASLRFTDRPIPPSLVVATCLSKRDTEVLIVDPPGENDSKDDAEKPKRISEREWEIPDTERFQTTTRLISEAKLLAFSGEDELSANRLEQTYVRTPLRRPAARQMETIENEFGVFRGFRQPVAFRDRTRVEVFQGIENRVRQGLIDNDPERVQQESREFRDRTAQLSAQAAGQPVVTQHLPDGLIVRAAGPDGSLLEFRVTAD